MNIPITSKLRNYWENLFPLILSVLVFIIIILSPLKHNINFDFCNKLSGPYLTIFSICFAFIFSSLSFLLCLTDNKFIRGMKQSGTFKKIIYYHEKCILWCAFAIFCGTIILFWSKEIYKPWQGAIFISAGIGSISSTWRIFNLFLKIIKGADLL